MGAMFDHMWIRASFVQLSNIRFKVVLIVGICWNAKFYAIFCRIQRPKFRWILHKHTTLLKNDSALYVSAGNHVIKSCPKKLVNNSES